MTTNHPEKLDAALTRPGRADVKVYIGNASKSQISRLYRRFFPHVKPELADAFASQIPDHTVSMAKVQHHLMLYRESPEQAAHNVGDLLKGDIYGQESSVT